MAEKTAGEEKLSNVLEMGEKLYPDTASTGRDKIRNQLRTAKDVWDRLQADLVCSVPSFTH